MVYYFNLSFVRVTRELVGCIDVRPVIRLKEFTDRLADIKQKALAMPCGNFSSSYRAVCDLFNIDSMEDVTWVSCAI